MLFQDEPDEDSGPGLFQDEKEEDAGPVLFQAERDEPVICQRHKPGSQNVSLSLLRDEPEEGDQQPPQVLFGMEADELSEDSAYEADDEDTKDIQALVQLSFSTLNQFLTTNLIGKGAREPTAEQAKKKRRYNNEGRAKDKDGELADYLQANTSFLVNMNATAAFTVHLCHDDEISHTHDVIGAYLRNLADCSLPVNELPHLRWHEEAPVIEVMPQDWVTCCLSFLFNGSRLFREPLDLNVMQKADGAGVDTSQPFLVVKKGFTRLIHDGNEYFCLSCMYLYLHLPCSITACTCMETVNFEAIQLSTQGSERQRKDATQLYGPRTTFDERQQTESGREQNESELLNELVSAYNSYRANAAIKRWQISGDQQAAIWCIIIGLDDTSRCLLRSHLDHNKWEESGIIADIGALVTPEAQHLHFQKYNMWWSNNARRMKKTMRCRLRWSEEQWTANVNHCCIFIWVRGHCENEALLTAEYGVVCANLSHDYKEAVSYNLRKNKADVIEQETVLHMRDQIQTGLNVADAFMQKRLLMVCADKNKGVRGQE
ncbi:unnamed protein product [Durusdinium trenchii]|uniref:Uncharacterized protein n=1 Tax=Durusdinium trenchii TaxID=1381693 RepID=A0ABP0MEP0_9DINO